MSGLQGQGYIRGYKEHKYHYCARCGDRVPLEWMVWQFGFLIGGPQSRCKCIDTGVLPLIGDRDKERARLVANYASSKELQPDPKLTESSLQQEDDISFSL